MKKAQQADEDWPPGCNEMIKQTQPRILTFIIPIPCRNFVVDWDLLCGYLRQTLTSLLNSKDPRLGVVVIGQDHPGSYLVEDERVHFIKPEGSALPAEEKSPPAIMRDWMSKLEVGRKYAAKELPSRYLMRMDADDFISNRIVGFVAEGDNAAGYRLPHGWVWNTGSRYLIEKTERFDLVCGSCIIVRSDVADEEFDFNELGVEIPEQAIITQCGYSRSLLINEAHGLAPKAFAVRGLKLQSAPFAAAVYRIGSRNSVTGRTNRVHSLRMLLGRLRRLRLLTPALRREFALCED